MNKFVIDELMKKIIMQIIKIVILTMTFVLGDDYQAEINVVQRLENRASHNKIIPVYRLLAHGITAGLMWLLPL